jgi:hypothetical protein
MHIVHFSTSNKNVCVKIRVHEHGVVPTLPLLCHDTARPGAQIWSCRRGLARTLGTGTLLPRLPSGLFRTITTPAAAPLSSAAFFFEQPSVSQRFSGTLPAVKFRVRRRRKPCPPQGRRPPAPLPPTFGNNARNADKYRLALS